MRAHVVNAFAGVVDYVAYPAGMLLVAPVILRHRGPEEYGLWIVTSAMVSTGAILASGFGDAGLQAIATARAHRARAVMVRVVRAMMTVHVAMGACFATLMFLLSRPVTKHLVHGAGPQLTTVCVLSLRLGALLLMMRAVEAACVSTQRGLESYRRATSVSVAGRLSVLVVAAALAFADHSVAEMIAGAAVVQGIALGCQLLIVAAELGATAVVPAWDREALRNLIHEGRYMWMIAAAGVAFSYADRLLLGVSRGAGEVVAYALCVQLAQPIYGLTANGLHFLFPYIARIKESRGPEEVRQLIRTAFTVNVGLALLLCVFVLAVGAPVLETILPGQLHTIRGFLPLIVLSFGLLSASVVATYGAMALGRARQVAMTVGFASIGMVLLMVGLMRVAGAQGLIFARLVFGTVCLVLYVPLLGRDAEGRNKQPEAVRWAQPFSRGVR